MSARPVTRNLPAENAVSWEEDKPNELNEPNEPKQPDKESKMIFEYCQKAVEKAQYRKLEDDTWFAEVPECQGVWANGNTVEECRKELITVLEEWVVLKLRDGDPVPPLDGLTVQVTQLAVA